MTPDMTISGFSMGKNALKLYYPMKQAIMSILPVVDEFVVALGQGDEDDFTRREIESINSSKIRIIDTIWEVNKYPKGTEHAHQTDIAKSYCNGNWLFYLQSDELIHEKDLSIIQQRCKELLYDEEVEGLVFNYIHFWGDYQHYQDGHCWYTDEIRIIRNDPDIHSWQSAQSFRRIPGFSGKNYRQTHGAYKLKVAKVNATVYHYGWVRPPALMQQKIKSFNINHIGREEVERLSQLKMYDGLFDYGNITRFKKYAGTHPAVMRNWIEKYDWDEQLRKKGPARSRNKLQLKHDLLKYRIVSWLEKHLFFGRKLGDFGNYILLRRLNAKAQRHKGSAK